MNAAPDGVKLLLQGERRNRLPQRTILSHAGENGDQLPRGGARRQRSRLTPPDRPPEPDVTCFRTGSSERMRTLRGEARITVAGAGLGEHWVHLLSSTHGVVRALRMSL